MHHLVCTLLLLFVAPSVLADFDPVKMLCMVNKERVKNGSNPLGLSSELVASAQVGSNEQAELRAMGHIGPDGSTPATRATDQGFPWKKVGENVAYGFTSMTKCMSGWMHSPGHRKNILDPKYTHFGGAVADDDSGVPYYTQSFASKKGHGGGQSFPECPSGGGSDDADDSSDDTSGSDYAQVSPDDGSVDGSGGYVVEDPTDDSGDDGGDMIITDSGDSDDSGDVVIEDSGDDSSGQDSDGGDVILIDDSDG